MNSNPSTGGLSLIAVEGLPEVTAGDDLAELIATKTSENLQINDTDVLVVAQKIVSKAEGRLVALNDITPSKTAVDLAAEVKKDPRLVELILSESRSIVRKKPGVLIVEHRTGHILANAGIDSSNVDQTPGDPHVLLWPEDPDKSARSLARELEPLLGIEPAVIINDSIGRPWRRGTVAQAIGCSGIAPLWNQIGEPDRFGNILQATESATADTLAAAASLVQGEAAQGLPVVWVRGYHFLRDDRAAAIELLRSRDEDMFR